MSLRKNSFYLTLSAALRLVISVISVPVLIRVLGLERYGIWIVLTSIPMLGALLEFGLAPAITKYVAEHTARQDWTALDQNLTASWLLMTLLGLLASAGLLAAVPYLSVLLFHGSPYLSDAGAALKLMAVLLLLYFWQHWLAAVQGGLMRYDLQAAIDTASSLAMTLGVLLIAVVNRSLAPLALWSVFVTAGSLAVYGIFLRRILPAHALRFQISWRVVKMLLHFGSLQWLASLGSSLFGYMDRIIVNYFLGASAAGIYAAATSVVSKINQLSALPLQVLPTWISTANALAERNLVRQIFIRATRLNGLVVFLMAAPLMFWAQPLARVLVGTAESGAASQLLLHLSLIYGLYSLAGAGFYTAIGVGSPEINATVGLTSGSLVIAALLIMTPRLGLMGAAWANGLYVLVLVTNLKVKRLIKLDTREYAGHFAPAVIALLVCWTLSAVLYSSQGILVLKASIFMVSGGLAVIFVGSWGFLKEIAHMPLDLLLRRKSGGAA